MSRCNRGAQILTATISEGFLAQRAQSTGFFIVECRVSIPGIIHEEDFGKISPITIPRNFWVIMAIVEYTPPSPPQKKTKSDSNYKGPCRRFRRLSFLSFGVAWASGVSLHEHRVLCFLLLFLLFFV